MLNMAKRGRALGRRHCPAVRGTLHKELPCRGAGIAHRVLAGEADRRATASSLQISEFGDFHGAHTNERRKEAWCAEFAREARYQVAVREQVDRRRLFDVDALPVGIELVCCHHR